jgi:hypothetical protein
LARLLHISPVDLNYIDFYEATMLEEEISKIKDEITKR